jgi:hypothetical protein
MSGGTRALCAVTGAALALCAAVAPAQAQSGLSGAGREVFGRIQSVTPTTVVISHITTARAVKRSTLTYNIQHATLTSENSLGTSVSVALSYLKPGDVVQGFSAVSATKTATDELKHIPVPLGTLLDLTSHFPSLPLNIVDLAGYCQLAAPTIANVCGSYVWGVLTHISGTQLTILAEGHRVKLNITTAVLVGRWPVVPVTTSALRAGQAIFVLSSVTHTALLNDVSFGTPVPVAVLYETG